MTSRAEPKPDAAQLHPDHAAADDDHMLGTLGNASAPVESTITFWSISTPGSGVTEEPVAIRIFFAV